MRDPDSNISWPSNPSRQIHPTLESENYRSLRQVHRTRTSSCDLVANVHVVHSALPYGWFGRV